MHHPAGQDGGWTTQQPPNADRRRWWSWSRQTLLFALAVSLFVHAVLLLWASLTIWAQAPASASQGDGESPLAVIAEGELSDVLQVGLADEVPTLSELEEPTIDTEGLDAAVPETDLSALDVSDIGQLGGAGDVDTEAGGAVFGGGGARFFGVEARGSRFAYVLDISGSMDGERMALLRGALAASVGGLLDHAQFLIVMYNHQAIPLGETAWRRATDAAKSGALAGFNAVDPAGSTNPVPAFRLVFATNPAPDAVYFMTDGAFAEAVTDELLTLIRSASGGKRVPVHCITLVENDSAQTMQTIARITGGSYTHIQGNAP